MNYEERGTFQNDGWAKQLVKFDGMVFAGKNGKKTVTPTDIDGVIQLEKEDCIIFFELKYKGGMPEGQKLALSRICDAVSKGGTRAVVFLAEHHTHEPDPIVAKDAIATQAYLDGEWKDSRRPITLLDAINWYVGHLPEKRDE